MAKKPMVAPIRMGRAKAAERARRVRRGVPALRKLAMETNPSGRSAGTCAMASKSPRAGGDGGAGSDQDSVGEEVHRDAEEDHPRAPGVAAGEALAQALYAIVGQNVECAAADEGDDHGPRRLHAKRAGHDLDGDYPDHHARREV